MVSICIFCGENKNKPLQKCKKCGNSPMGSNVDMVKSLIASQELRDEEGEPLISEEELLEMSIKIKSKEYFFDQNKIDLLLEQKKLLDESPKIAWGFLFFGFYFLIIPIIAIFIFLLKK